MSVDIGDILHVLAHELRTPIGIAHGYVRLLLEDRLPQESDRRRALEQMQRALGRLSELSQESSELATWFEQDREKGGVVPARNVLEQVADAHYDAPVTVDASTVSDGACIRTSDSSLLARAIVGIVRATARELRGLDCAVLATTDATSLVVLVGPEDRLTALGAGRTGPEASPFAVERGGLGLSLVHAAIVLDAHGAERWTLNGSRQTAGFRLPLEERSRT